MSDPTYKATPACMRTAVKWVEMVEGAYFEDDEGGDEDVFLLGQTVDPAEHGLERRHACQRGKPESSSGASWERKDGEGRTHEVCGGVKADIGECVELVGDLREGRRDDTRSKDEGAQQAGRKNRATTTGIHVWSRLTVKTVRIKPNAMSASGMPVG